MIQKLLRCIGTANGDRGKEFPVPENKGWLYNDLIKSFKKENTPKRIPGKSAVGMRGSCLPFLRGNTGKSGFVPFALQEMLELSKFKNLIFKCILSYLSFMIKEICGSTDCCKRIRLVHGTATIFRHCFYDWACTWTEIYCLCLGLCPVWRFNYKMHDLIFFF